MTVKVHFECGGQSVVVNDANEGGREARGYRVCKIMKKCKCKRNRHVVRKEHVVNTIRLFYFTCFLIFIFILFVFILTCTPHHQSIFFIFLFLFA